MANRRRFHTRVYLSILHRQRMKCARCGDRLERGKFQFNHMHGLESGGPDTPDNLEAICTDPCHAAITARQAKDRAKVKRIRSQFGLRYKKPNKREKYLARVRARSAMP